MYFATGELFKVASRAEMFFGEGKIDWVEACCYLDVNLCSGKYFCTDYKERRRKFCTAANDAISNKFALSVEFYLLILRTQCIPIITYGTGVWECKNEQFRILCVLFNNNLRKVFCFGRFVSVKSILRGFFMLPLDLYIDRIRLLLLYDCLKSERSVVRMCAEVSTDDEVVRLCNEFNFA